MNPEDALSLNRSKSALPLISVVIPAYNEAKFIASCLDSVYDQDYPREQMEVIVVDGASTDETAKIVEMSYPEVLLLHNPRKIVPISMNMGIKKASGEYVVRLDAHSEYPRNYISRLIGCIKGSDLANVGALWETLPANNSDKANAIAIAMRSSFGIGNATYRTGVKEEKFVDTVPFGCYPRELLLRIGLYDEELIRNQDDELNGRIIQAGGKILLLPDLSIRYFARDTIKKTSKMFYQYGLFKPLVNKKLKKPATARQFAPLLLVLGLVIGLPLSFLHWFFLYAYLAAVLLYVLAILLASGKSAPSLAVFKYLVVVYPIIHLSYGWGYLHGVWKLLFKKPFHVESNR